MSENDPTIIIRQASRKIIAAIVPCVGIALIYLSVIANSGPPFARPEPGAAGLGAHLQHPPPPLALDCLTSLQSQYQRAERHQ